MKIIGCKLGFPSDQYSYNNMGAGAALKRGEVEEKSEKNKSKLIGVFARINYSSMIVI